MKALLKLVTPAVAACLFIAAHPAAAQKPAAAAYPSKPVRMIVPFAPGGGTDIIARLVAQELGKDWAQTLVVDNRSGSGGTIGTKIAVDAPPDGYTMVMCSLGVSIAPALYSKLSFDPLKDLAPISLVAQQPFVYVVASTLGVNSMKELIAMAKAKPGQLRYGSGGVGGSSHMGTELLKVMTGIDMQHIPYKGTAPALTAMLAGEIHTQLIGIATVVPHLKAGRMKALAVSGAKRSPAAPDIPTVAETGLAGYAFDVWYGMLFPARTPTAITRKVSADINAALRTPALAQRFTALGLEPEGNTPEAFSAMLRREIAKWHKVVKEAKIEVR
jgi:tripartite-type tricarboxylate transporter receptor subunit TctC